MKNATSQTGNGKTGGNGNGRIKPSQRDEQRIEFAKIWNDKKYRTPYDLELALGSSWHSIQARARRYRKYREDHPELAGVLPLLLWRKATLGGLIVIDEEQMLLLEPYRIDPKKLANAKGYVVTAAQRGAMLNTHFWNSLKTYCEYRGFVLVVLPIQYGKFEKESTFSEELKGYITFDDVPLYKGTLNLSTTRLRPTLQRFLTESVCEMGGTVTQVLAAPRHELEHRPRMGHHYPKAIMTTGAVTHPNYKVDKLGQQDRTGEIATANHAYGAIVIEPIGKDAFQFRQLNAGNRGIFFDIDPINGGGRLFTPKEHTNDPDAVCAVVLGDEHIGKTDPLVTKATFERKDSIVKTLNPNHIIFHDLLDGESISHWDSHTASRRIHKAKTGGNDLRKELDMAVEYIRWVLKQSNSKVHIVPSNHNEFVKRWLEGMEFFTDDVNLEFGMELSLMVTKELEKRNPGKHEVRSIDPVNLYFRSKFENTLEGERLNTLERQDVLLLPETLSSREEKKKILLSMHGDIGALGGKTSGMASFRKMNQRLIVGHNHSAAILGPIWRVGTSTHRQEHYMNTPMTNWTNTHAVIFRNGQRMLVNIIKGKWHGYCHDKGAKKK